MLGELGKEFVVCLLIVVFWIVFITLLGLLVGESPGKWWRGFWN